MFAAADGVSLIKIFCGSEFQTALKTEKHALKSL